MAKTAQVMTVMTSDDKVMTNSQSYGDDGDDVPPFMGGVTTHHYDSAVLCWCGLQPGSTKRHHLEQSNNFPQRFD